MTGDKRPCERCGDKKICKDGKRKKAKYLADAPDEDLTPGQDQVKESHYVNISNDWHAGPQLPRSSYPGPGIAGLYATQHPNYPFVTNGQQVQMPFQPYTSQQMSIVQPYTLGPHQQAILPDYSRAIQPNMPLIADPNHDLSLGDFHVHPYLEEYSFANQYGASEFAAISQLTSGMEDTPPSESTGTLNSGDDANYVPGVNTPGYGSAAHPHGYPQDQVIHNSRPSSRQEADLFNLRAQDLESVEGLVKQEEPAGYPIGAFNSYPSPSFSGSSPQGMTTGIHESPSVKSMYTNINPSRQAQLRETPRPVTSSQQQISSKVSPSTTSTPTISTPTIPPSVRTQSFTSSRRHRNPSTIYNTVTEPHSYTKAFHDLMELIRNRFSPSKTARIAKALASIRPSFISSLTKLDDDDRVFMEKCLQRTLLEYDDFLSATGTPTIICRRTGEVVAVGEGFSVLTGWRKGVLLGKEPNLNVNRGGDASGPSGTGATTFRGTNTPRVPDRERPDPLDGSRQKPVSIVDLLDDESACDFFDDYSHLAFGDSRGSVTTPCKFLTYRLAKDADPDKALDSEAVSWLKRQRDATRSGKDGNAGMTQIGDDKGKVDCMLCWSVKRDVFDIPMLFVMNVLPCI